MSCTARLFSSSSLFYPLLSHLSVQLYQLLQREICGHGCRDYRNPSAVYGVREGYSGGRPPLWQHWLQGLDSGLREKQEEEEQVAACQMASGGEVADSTLAAGMDFELLEGRVSLLKDAFAHMQLRAEEGCTDLSSRSTETHAEDPVDVLDAKGKAVVVETTAEEVPGSGGQWLCAICRGVILPEDTAQLKGCEHAYCVKCILQWASYAEVPWCPQCRTPFSMLYTFRTLEGRLGDVMVEESVCLLLRAPWFKSPGFHEEPEAEDPFLYEDYDDEEFDEDFHPNSTLRIGNRRFGETGFVRSGRMEARPAGASSSCARGPGSSGSARGGKEKALPREQLGRRAKRAQKRVNADSVVAAKHQQTRTYSAHH